MNITLALLLGIVIGAILALAIYITIRKIALKGREGADYREG